MTNKEKLSLLEEMLDVEEGSLYESMELITISSGILWLLSHL